MYSLTKFTREQIQQFIASQRDRPFSYAEVGASQAAPPAGYTVDHNRMQLGVGVEIFERAKTAVQRWEMFHFNWLQLCWPGAPIEVGSTVAIMVRALGIWSLNACRIVYLIEEKGAIEKFGFAYGTLPEHAERGEERFCVEWHHQNDTVWYDILAFSRPHQLLAKVTYPYTRQLQKRFAVASKQAMLKAVNLQNKKS
ncbi:MAG TPA: DUF1990 domain-containing protein [Anaerolineae bacterium]|nr:DUF1990 domain-containing protein [Anaerolineae bacterium]